MTLKRLQTGQLIESSGFIYIRFYRDGKRVAEKLCQVDDKHYSAKARTVKMLQAQFMATVNAPAVPSTEISVSEFYETHYIPYIEAVLKPSSIHGYKKLWDGVLSDHFKNRTLADYKTVDGSEFLTSLCSRMGRTSIQHVRSLCSAIFSLGVNKGLIERNVWREVKVLAKPQESKRTKWYTLDEALSIIADLKGRERAAFGLAFYLALRPGELGALRFEDFEGDHVNVSRSVWRTHVGTTKTTASAAKMPLTSQARKLFEEWREACGNPSEGFLFQNASGKPLATTALTRPMKATVGKRWKGFYSARRGMATLLTEMTGNPISAQGLLRHRSLSTTLAHYVREMPEQTTRGMKMVEEKVKGKK